MPVDAAVLDEAEKQFWQGLWDTACQDAVVDLGIDMVRFGSVVAAVVAEEYGEPALNFVLGAAAAGAIEHDHLPAALTWIERHDVDFRVAITAGLPEQAIAERWLEAHGYRLQDGPVKLVRDGSAPDFGPSHGIDVYERIDPCEDEGFGDPLAESLGFANWASTFFLDLPGAEDWRCYCGADGDEPLSYVAMHLHDDIAVLALASRLAGEREGLGQRAVLHRAIADAAEIGCEAMIVAEAGEEPAVADRQALLRAGFEPAIRSFTWLPRARVLT